MLSLLILCLSLFISLCPFLCLSLSLFYSAPPSLYLFNTLSCRKIPLCGLHAKITLPFLLLARQPGMGFLPIFAKYKLISPSLSSLPSRPFCLTEAGLGALLSKQS